MVFGNRNTDFSCVIDLLHLLKYYHDIGIYEAVICTTETLEAMDIYELYTLGIENVAPIFGCDEIAVGYDDELLAEDAENDDAQNMDGRFDHYHLLYQFSSNEMKEYYRLCRLYDYRESIAPQNNPFAKAAEQYYSSCMDKWCLGFCGGFDNDLHPQTLLVEICLEESFDELGLIKVIHGMLTYYKEQLRKLRIEMAKCGPVFLPALPAPEEGCGNVL